MIVSRVKMTDRTIKQTGLINNEKTEMIFWVDIQHFIVFAKFLRKNVFYLLQCYWDVNKHNVINN